MRGFYFQNGLRRVAFFIAHLDAMQPLNVQFLHFRGNRVFPISGQTIHTGAHQEMRTQRFGRTEKLVNVRFFSGRRCARSVLGHPKGLWIASGSPA